MILHKSPDPYIELIQSAANELGIPAVYVEKDYWVTQALKRLNESDYRESVVFKGGTALSKAHRLIERFSEDIDLALRAGDLGDSRRKKLIKAVESAITQDLTYQKDHPLESKGSRFRKTAYAFPSHTDSSQLGQVADTILVEINAFADPEPATKMPIASLIHDFLQTTRRVDLVDQFELDPFDILVLNVERTLCEKIMGLVRAGYEDDPLSDFKRKIRHFYDITMILSHERYKAFVSSDAFIPMIDSVRLSDRASMPGAAKWLDPPIIEAPLFAETHKLWDNIKSEFHGTFKEMIYGDSLPDDNEVLNALKTIGMALDDVDPSTQKAVVESQ